MNTSRSCLLIAVASLAFSNAQAQLHEDTPPHTTATTSTGTILKKGPTIPDIKWDSEVPLNRTYGKLTPEQRAELHSMYATLAPGDEPPFPEKGLKSIFTAIKMAQRKHQAVGVLNLAVTVGPDGVPTKVENLGTVSTAKITEVAEQALMSTKYKPAVCGGTPCTMQFRFTQKLKSAG